MAQENFLQKNSSVYTLSAYSLHIVTSETVCQGCFWHCIWHDKYCYYTRHLIFIGAKRLSLSRLFLALYFTWQMLLLYQAFDIYRRYTFEFIKAVSGTVFDMINAIIIPSIWYLSEQYIEFIKAVSGTVFEKINSVYQVVNETDSCLLMRCASLKNRSTNKGTTLHTVTPFQGTF